MARSKMTEKFWLDPPKRDLSGDEQRKFVEFLQEHSTPRKLRLFACACVRAAGSLPGDSRARVAITSAEDFADARLQETDLDPVRRDAYEALADAQVRSEISGTTPYGEDLVEVILKAVCGLVHRDILPTLYDLLCGDPFPYRVLLPEVFGNPFQPVTVVPEWLAWNHGLVRKMAEGIYEERHFDECPILADALTEAGCEVPALLEHLRGPGPHVRGCWGIDLLLGLS
jgi:hypothetical protein